VGSADAFVPLTVCAARADCAHRPGAKPALCCAVLSEKLVTNADSLRFDIVGHVLLIVHADMPPHPSDWSRMITVRNANRDKLHGNLVIAPPRASINAAQRADVSSFMKETGTSVAVVTDSALIRGVARAVGFLGVQVRAFAPTEMTSAFNFLVVPPSRHDDMLRRIAALQAGLGSNTLPPTEKPV
jgi:hypothetical protein